MNRIFVPVKGYTIAGRFLTMIFCRPFAGLVSGLLVLTAAASSAADSSSIDFGKQIRPIFVGRCFECHGPEKQEGSLRLDRRDDARKGGDSGPAIVEKSPDDSLLVQRLMSDDPDVRMPLGKKALPREEIDLIKQWIRDGAAWPNAWSGDTAAVTATHWSFRRPERPTIPVVTRPQWIRNEIDAFVLSRLEQGMEGLSPSADANPHTLVRRVYLDLIGVPPSPEEADRWMADSRPGAYERLVDYLLATPQYGERWARRWLDLARYADTNGYEKDRPRSIWPYRDWVVRALNQDLPFDEFTVKQLAGDMFESPSQDDLIATGFHRNTMLNEEGGIDPLEFRFLAMVDRVSTTGTTWLGLTIGCAQCHTHKYDPLTHREYYEFMALLNNADEPDFELSDESKAAERKEIEKRIGELVANLPKRFEIPKDDTAASGASVEQRRREFLDRRFQEWQQQESAKAVRWIELTPRDARSNLPLLTILPDKSILASGDQTKSDKYEVKYDVDFSQVTAIRLEALPHDSLPLHGPGRAYYEGPKGDFFLSELQVDVNGQPLKFVRATHDYSQLAIGGGKHGAQLTFDGNTTTGWSTKGAEGVPHHAVYNLERPIDLLGELNLDMIFERHYSCGLGRFRISVTSDAKPAEASVHNPEIESILAISAADRSHAQRKQLFDRFLAVAPELASARDEIQKLRDSLPKPVTSLVLAERPEQNPRPTYLHHRGEFLQPKEKVQPSVPDFLPPFRDGVNANRLALARWFFSEENPLTARVTVNRHWQSFFGRGLVRTTDDFGLQGESPSHPELLDWLACELASDGWSIKRLHRLIVTSSTYRQSSRVSAELLARDPKNVLLARGPRERLEAEQIRDSALSAAGLLSTKMGGPGVYPPQPESVTTEGTYGALKWTASVGEDRYRRGLYTYMKRTAPFALHITFDGPSGESCLARREVSNSPLQALALLNDVIFLEAAQELGRIAAREPGSDESRATSLFRRCLTRTPDAEELNELIGFAKVQRERFAKQTLEATKIAGDESGDVVERATWTSVARALLNLHEMVTKL